MVEKFIELFNGYQGDFGIADMSSAQLDTDKNKLKPNYEWAGRPITQGDYRDHVEGKISIGIQPCRLDKTVQFGCIDIDSKDDFRNAKKIVYKKTFLINKKGKKFKYIKKI